VRFSNARFLVSAVNPEQYPRCGLPEIAVMGRSNVGKSSFINALANQRRLARISSTPGFTQSINFYDIDGVFCLVDLPGYGYARVPREVKEQWGPMIETYLERSKYLRGAILLVDARHDPTADDKQMLTWLKHHAVPALVVGTKIDKVEKSRRGKQIDDVQTSLGCEMLPFSAQTGEGKQAVINAIGDMAAHQ